MSERTDATRGTRSGGAVGLTVFASMIMILVGTLQAIAGLVALVDDEFVVVTQEWVFKLDTTTWGWIHLLIGIVVLLAGVGLYSGAVWARTIGVIMAMVSAVAMFAWMPWYPVWAISVMALDVFIIWALTAHGRDITQG